jgi:hypothetical protein
MSRRACRIRRQRQRRAERAEEQPWQTFAAADRADLVADRAQHVVAGEHEEEARSGQHDGRAFFAAHGKHAAKQRVRCISGRRWLHGNPGIMVSVRRGVARRAGPEVSVRVCGSVPRVARASD